MTENVLVVDCADGQRRPQGGFKVPVAKTAAYQVLHTDHETIFTNVGAGGSVTFTLPVTGTSPGQRVTGKRFVFVKAANQNLVISPGTGAQINANTVSTGVFQNVTSSATSYPSVEVIGISETQWTVFPGVGTWANG